MIRLYTVRSIDTGTALALGVPHSAMHRACIVVVKDSKYFTCVKNRYTDEVDFKAPLSLLEEWLKQQIAKIPEEQLVGMVVQTVLGQDRTTP